MSRSYPHFGFRPRLGLIAAASALAGVAAVSGCHRSGSVVRAVKLPPPLAQAMAIGGGLNAGGEDPLWALQIRAKTVMFTSSQVAAITLTTTTPEAAPNGGAWAGEAGGRPFRAVITAAPCRDQATGLTYPLSAEVQALGLTYRGCAARKGQGLGPRT
jgi:uncharacterized membrane protein